MHWKSRVMMLLRATRVSTWPPSPSAKPLKRSRATIMKSLSGASYWSGCWLYIWDTGTEEKVKVGQQDKISAEKKTHFLVKVSVWCSPWPELMSSEPEWRSVDRRAHSRGESRSAALWQQMTDTRAEGRGLCLHPSAHSTLLSAEASASVYTPKNTSVWVWPVIYWFLYHNQNFQYIIHKAKLCKSVWLDVCVLSSQADWDGVPQSLPVFLWHHKGWAGSYVDTSQKQKPVCQGWSSDKGPVLYMPPPPGWRRRFKKEEIGKEHIKYECKAREHRRDEHIVMCKS